MHDSMVGVFMLLANTIFFSVSCLAYVLSGVSSGQMSSWVGIFGTPLSTLILSTEMQTFQPCKIVHLKQFYLSIISAFVLGGFGTYLNYCSLNYILPADSTMVAIFTKLVVSVILQSVEDRERPSLMTILSVFSGVVGTAVICHPKTLITGKASGVDTLKGRKIKLPIHFDQKLNRMFL